MRSLSMLSLSLLVVFPAFAQSSHEDNAPSPYAQQVQQAFHQADSQARQQFEKNYPKPSAPVIVKKPSPATPTTTPAPQPAPKTYTPPISAAPPPLPKAPDVTAAPDNTQHNIYLPPQPQN